CLRAVLWTFGVLLRSLAPLSVRMHSSGADRSCALADTVAVITGSTEGISFAITQHLAQDGAHVVVSSRKQQNLDQAVAVLQGEGLRLSVMGTVCHVGKAEDCVWLVATALEHRRGVSFLVCVAGVNPVVGSTFGRSEQIWDKVRSGEASAPALLLSQLQPHKENRENSIETLLSIYVIYFPFFSQKLEAYNVKNSQVNCLVPGVTDTDFRQVQGIITLSPISSFHTVGWPEDCAGLASFLCSPDASYITSKNIMWLATTTTSEGHKPRVRLAS
uniref:Dehydrogenase/reductase 2 n=1 Tax=Equus caballus TaxID=9796 RepID=A0A5F5PM24_HORSE